MTEDRSKRRFLSVVFTVLSFRKPLLIRLMMVMGLIVFTFVSKTKSDFFQRRSSSDD